MKTIVVSNGDIQLNSGKLQFAIGSSKLSQDISLWLQEPLGTGYTTPNFGSLLTSMVGQAGGDNTVISIENEVLRVLQLYQSQQVSALKQAQNSAQLSYWNKSEIIQQIVSVTAQQSSAMNTEIDVDVQILTLANNNVNISLSINSMGVTVSNG